MSLCDKCYSPGACCKRFPLNLTFWDDQPVNRETLLKLAEAYSGNENIPFEPLQKEQTFSDKDGRTYSTWLFNCPNLLSSGRCGDYENRPDVCRRFEPASDRLCVHFMGAEGVDLVDGLP